MDSGAYGLMLEGMKDKVIAFLVLTSFLLAAVKFAATEAVDLLKYLVVQAHDLWLFLLNVWK
jgi:hypothetical protein